MVLKEKLTGCMKKPLKKFQGFHIYMRYDYSATTSKGTSTETSL